MNSSEMVFVPECCQVFQTLHWLSSTTSLYMGGKNYLIIIPEARCHSHSPISVRWVHYESDIMWPLQKNDLGNKFCFEHRLNDSRIEFCSLFSASPEFLGMVVQNNFWMLCRKSLSAEVLFFTVFKLDELLSREQQLLLELWHLQWQKNQKNLHKLMKPVSHSSSPLFICWRTVLVHSIIIFSLV